MRIRTTRILFALIMASVFAGCTDETQFDASGWSPSQEARYLSVDKDKLSFGAGSELTQSIMVSAINSSWQFTGMAEWLSLDNTSGNGDANVRATAEVNTSGDDIRTSVFTLSSKSSELNYSRQITASQTAASPYLKVSSTTLQYSGGKSSQTVTVEANIQWDATCNSDWVHLNRVDNRLEISVDENLTASLRSATVALNGKISAGTSSEIKISQSSAKLDVSESRLPFMKEGGSTTVQLHADASWTARKRNNASWIDVVPGSGAAGDVDIQIVVLPNGTVGLRSETIDFIIGTNVVSSLVIEQDGLYVRFGQEAVSFPSTGGTQNLLVKSNTKWQILEKPQWITVSEDSGEKDKTIELTADELWDTSSRTGTVRFGYEGTTLSAEIQVSQSPRVFEDIETILPFGADADSASVDIKTDGKWRATVLVNENEEKWITLQPEKGTGESSMKVSVSENLGEGKRTGYINVTVGSCTRTVVVEQKGKYLTVPPSDGAELPSRGGSHLVEINTNDSWTASKESSWITLSDESGRGNVSLRITAEDNPSINKRKDITYIRAASISTPYKVETIQSGRYLKTDTEFLSFTYNGGEQYIHIDTDADIEVSTTESWVSVNCAGNVITVTVEAPQDKKSRQASVVIEMKGLKDGESYVLTIPVKQSGEIAIDRFDEDDNWNFGEDTEFTVNKSGFEADEDWNYGSSIYY